MTRTEPLDGRVARRERNLNAVIDVVIEMFGEEALFPTIEQAAARSGLSVRSLYRYFADQGALVDAAIKRSREIHVDTAHLSRIGQGPLADRIDDFVAMRLRLHEAAGAVYRATLVNAPRHPAIRDELANTRQLLRQQLETQFAVELAARKGGERDAVLAAGDVVTQLDAIDLLRRYRQLSVAETSDVLRTALTALLDPGRGAP